MKGVIIIILLLTPIICSTHAKAQIRQEPEEVSALFTELYSCNFYEAKNQLDTIISKFNSSMPDLVDICITNYHWWQLTTSREYSHHREKMIAAIERTFNRHKGVAPESLSEDELFALVHSYAFLTRIDMHEGRYIGAASYLRKSMDYLNEVLPRAEDNLKFTLLAGLYNNIMGSIMERFPIFYPIFIFAPASDKEYGSRLLLKCAEEGNPMISTEACYFIARVQHEAHKDYEGADKFIKKLLLSYPDNQYLRSYRINILADSGNIKELEEEYHRLLNFDCQSHFSQEQNNFLIEATESYIRKKRIKF